MSPNSSRWDRVCYAVVRALGALQEYILHRLVHERCWRSADGTVHRICDMKPRHLENCRRMIERDGDFDSAVWHALRDEQVRRAYASTGGAS